MFREIVIVVAAIRCATMLTTALPKRPRNGSAALTTYMYTFCQHTLDKKVER